MKFQKEEEEYVLKYGNAHYEIEEASYDSLDEAIEDAKFRLKDIKEKEERDVEWLAKDDDDKRSVQIYKSGREDALYIFCELDDFIDPLIN